MAEFGTIPREGASQPERHRLTVRPSGCAVDLHAVYADEVFLERDALGVRWSLPLVPLVPLGPQVLRLRFDSAPQTVSGALSGWMQTPLAALAADPRRHDGMLTALTALEPMPDGSFVGSVQPVSYFCTRARESLLDGSANLRSRDQPIPGRLPRPQASLMACDIGVVVLLRTGDGYLVAQRRSAQLDWRPEHLSVSASGSLEPVRDFVQSPVGLAGLLAGARRELAEELGVGGPQDPCRDQLEIRSLGIWRELQRGGKPELYTVARTPLSMDEVRMLHEGAPDADESRALVALNARDCSTLLEGILQVGGMLGDSRIANGPVDLALVAALLLSGPAEPSHRPVAS